MICSISVFVLMYLIAGTMFYQLPATHNTIYIATTKTLALCW